MAAPSFTSIPLELRERVYANLLTYFPTPGSTPAPSSPICALLTLNRRTHAEISEFLKRQLLVLLKTNDKDFIKHTLDIEWGPTKVPLVSQLCSHDGAVVKSSANAPISMELEFYMYMTSNEADSYAAFLVPASSLNIMVRAQGSPDFHLWTMQSLLSVKMLNAFSHTKEEATRLLLQPYIKQFMGPVFVGIRTEGVDPEVTTQLRDKLVGTYNGQGHLRKLESLTQVPLQKSQGDWARIVEGFRIARNYAEMLWENHRECMNDGSTPPDGILRLWLMHSGLCGNLTQVLLNVAANETANVPVDAKHINELYARAREAAEDAIRHLNMLPSWGRPETTEKDPALLLIRTSKAKISYRAHAACKGMGDIDAAVGYLKEALRHEPETSEKLLRSIEELKQEGASDTERVDDVVEWE